MPSIRVVSWNIDARASGLEERIAWLGTLGADVVVLQEVPRSAQCLLEEASGFAWGELAVAQSEPATPGGRPPPARRQGPAVLGSQRVMMRTAGQVPEAWFVQAGGRAGLTEEEVRRIGWRHKTIYVDVSVEGAPLRVAGFHARPGSSGLGWVKQLFHRVCATWVAACQGPMLFGVDANSPNVDHPEPQQWRPFMAGEATLIGPSPSHHLVDALPRWLDDHPHERRQVLAQRPDGPLAVTYRTPRSRAPKRYDHLFTTRDITIDALTHRPPGVDGSDHGAILADLTIPEPARGRGGEVPR